MNPVAVDAPLRVVLYEGHGSFPLAEAERYEIVQSLLERGYPVTSVVSPEFLDRFSGARRPAGKARRPSISGICEGGATQPDGMPRPENVEEFGRHDTSARAGGRATATGGTGTVLVLGRFTDRQPDEAETRDGGAKVFFRQLGDLAAGAVADLVGSVRAAAEAGAAGRWKPWFPVIDFGRCTNCMQCLSFCLFDVYGVSADGKIQVQNPTNCKTDCPACSRVCPEVAILFPKYKAGPINGDEVSQADVEREKMKVDISALLGGDIYAALRERSERARTRFAKERDDQRALEERRRCLLKLQQELDIPPEVLAALPTQDQIREKAAQAAAAARKGAS